MDRRVEIQGHRGARGLRPENTLPAFAHALALGVDAVEFDVGFSADGVVVLHHDQTVSALTTRDTFPAFPGDPQFPYVGRPVRALRLAQLKTLDSGVRAEDPSDPYRRTSLALPGTPLATLDEACALLGPAEGVRLCVELKTDPSWPDAEVGHFVSEVLTVLAAHGLLHRTRLLGFDWRFLKHTRRLEPSVARVALAEPPTLTDSSWLAGADPRDPALSALSEGATIFSPQYTMLDDALFARASGLGLPVTVWTVNTAEAMARYLDMGVAAIVTDYPDLLRVVMAAHGHVLPSPFRPLEPAAV
ncbi:glycerophosphodiester phosphodiesterase family protein [Actinocorallia sp. A-T 12471]|uniref:glycerophosphodiester phosphodiesterase family protein n=1 Tax=Actinocorallia sp. A-T 12471 TaxID=3089813 RepID=UPI0029D24E5A|nr:glycerophosphodiester phosphodiesterase family protein [Actinocorallia sp. A-T 12471]MDX6741967.1 glycerophosphodiester phosphodiesterase family protein [Actinocorallia sp. A-T 12471]